MALTSDWSEVADYKTLTNDERVTLDALIWATMAIGINSITLANAREFFARVSFWEKVVGAYRISAEGKSLYLTPEDVLRFVGLRTNASPLTITKFRNHAYAVHERFNVPSSIGE